MTLQCQLVDSPQRPAAAGGARFRRRRHRQRARYTAYGVPPFLFKNTSSATTSYTQDSFGQSESSLFPADSIESMKCECLSKKEPRHLFGTARARNTMTMIFDLDSHYDI